MPIRSDGFMTGDVLIARLGIATTHIGHILRRIHPVTRRYPDAAGLYYSPETVETVQRWFHDHPDYLAAYTAKQSQWKSANNPRPRRKELDFNKLPFK
jgi:hypothetical protein